MIHACGMPKGTCQAEVMLNSEKIKLLTVIKLHLSEGIRKLQKIKNFVAIYLKHLESYLTNTAKAPGWYCEADFWVGQKNPNLHDPNILYCMIHNITFVSVSFFITVPIHYRHTKSTANIIMGIPITDLCHTILFLKYEKLFP